MAAVGSAFCWPAMSGALPCTGSNMLGVVPSGLMLPLAASGNINPEGTAPSMFEPVHGSAPDIAGQSKADPTAAILSAEAARIEQAVGEDLVERPGAWAARTTVEVGDDIAERVAG